MTALIWKHEMFPEPFEVRTVLDLTVGATVLGVAEQPGVGFCLWEAHDPTEGRTEKRAFRMVGTGHVEDFDPGRHVGTMLVRNFVWHVFEETP